MDSRFQFLPSPTLGIILILSLACTNPSFAQVCTPNSILLDNQDNVDNFQANHGPCDHVREELAISGSDIIDLNGLSEITSVGTLRIEANDVLTNLDGLNVLTEVRSRFFIRYNQSLTNVNGLSALIEVNGLYIWDNAALTHLDGLSALTSLGDSDLSIMGNPALTNLDGLSSLTSLGRALFLTDNQALASLEGLSALTRVAFTLMIRNNDALTQVDGLAALASVGGAVYIEQNDSLSNLDGLAALTSVNGNLEIRHNDALTDLDGLSSLASAGNWAVSSPWSSKQIVIDGNDALTNLDGLSSLTRAGTLGIHFNTALDNLDGLSGITEVTGWMFVSSNDSLKNIDGLSNIANVGDFVAISDNDQITDLHGLSALTQLGTDLRIYDNAALNNLDALRGVTVIPGDLWIESNPLLADLGGLYFITEVGGALRINDNDLLTNLDVFEPLQNVQAITLEGNEELADCMGVLTLVDPIDDYEPGPGPGTAGVPDVADTIVVANNAKGCNSTSEILAEVPMSYLNAGLNDAWFNPATDGQGFLITVLPEIKQIFVAWFTFDTQRPPEDVTAILGEPGHRWLTAHGEFEENAAGLILYVTKGGLFDSEELSPETEPYGEFMLEFSTCNAGTVTYDIPSIPQQGVMPIERIALDNIPLCYVLNDQVLDTFSAND